MILQDIIFWTLAVVSVVSAIGVVFLRDIFRAALLLVLLFLTIAGLFVLLSAEFLAVVQVLIYAGAISILIIFSIMLTRNVHRGNMPGRIQLLAFLFSGFFLIALVFVITNTSWPLLTDSPIAQESLEAVYYDTPAWIGSLLLRDFVLPFELVSVLLLATLIGALVLVRESE